MRNKTSTIRLTISALLVAIGILIPMIMPVKIMIEPASFTLASHLPIFIAIFLSPKIAVVVSLFTAFGFLIAGFPIVITMRALSHVVFAYVGSILIKGRHKDILESPLKSQTFSALLALIHAVAEVLVVSLFFFGAVPGANYQDGFFYAVFLLVGVGTFIHSMVDFILAQLVWRVLYNRMSWVRGLLNSEH